MHKSETIKLSFAELFKAKYTDFKLLVKFRLSLIVVFSAAMGFVWATAGALDWATFLLFLVGGFCVTAASNTFNQVIEKDLDKLMSRTEDRPLAAGRMKTHEGLLIGGFLAVLGIFILGYYFNTLTALLGASSLIAYTFIYTPLKRVTNFSVFVGAIPGALPPLIAWVAVQGSIGTEALMLFAIQFMWQFPHFWAIAWVSFEDYKKAGFYMLPASGGKSRNSAIQIVIYLIFLLPISLLPYMLGYTGLVSAIIVSIAGLAFFWQGMSLYMKCGDKEARQLMFGSFVYLPVVLISLVFDKI